MPTKLKYQKMDAIEREVFRELLPDIFEDLDPVDILPVLYKILPLDFCKRLRKLQMRHERVSVFIEKALTCMTLNEVFEAFAYQDGYTFFIDKIEDMLKQKYQSNEIYYCKKGNIFTKHRQELVEFRHTLKVYSLSGDQASFEREVNNIVNLWTNSNYRTSLSTRDHQKLADRYFFVRDAQCENMRLRYDRALDSTNILSEILNVAPFTSNPTLTTMMYLARKGSAMIMTDPSSHEKAFTQCIETAVQNTELVQSCRETGLVFYIKYNFVCLKYERSCDPEIKKSLFRIAEKAVDDFCREYEKVASDFQNIFRIKLAHLRLGIGVLGNNIEWVSITREDIREATVLLNQVKLEQLSNRWKWGFYIAKAKINWITGDLENALHIAENAYSLVVKGNFKSEIKGTTEIIETLNLRIDGKTNSLDVNKSRPTYINTQTKGNSSTWTYYVAAGFCFMLKCLVGCVFIVYVFNYYILQ